jgi:hypothetical protein
VEVDVEYFREVGLAWPIAGSHGEYGLRGASHRLRPSSTFSPQERRTDLWRAEAALEAAVETEHDTALIVEDDFRPRIRFPKSLDLLGIRTEFDICWLSERMATAKSGELTFNRVEDVAELRTANTSAGQRWHWAVGTEGYLVSRSGALKLLEYVNEDGFFCGVDARLLAYSLSPESKSRMSVRSLSRKLVDAQFQIIKQRKPILSLAASVGLIGLIDSGSDRKEQNSAG